MFKPKNYVLKKLKMKILIFIINRTSSFYIYFIMKFLFYSRKHKNLINHFYLSFLRYCEKKKPNNVY